MTDTINDKLIIVYSLSTNDVTFALTKIGEEFLCGYNLIKTEHPKLLILETKKGDSFARKNKAIENVDMFAYINSKFVYVEKHIRTQMKYLYKDILQQRCNLEQQVIKNALSIAIHSPDEFAYQFMKGPGYMATISGEVVYIIKCTPVEVKIRHIDECYHQLPVLKENETLFMAPRTHILMKTGIQTTCNKIIPTMYFLNDAWYRMSPTPELGVPPTKIKPMTEPTWQYKNPGSLATSGIYSNTDLENLREHIMFPAEKNGILNTMARSVKGKPTEQQGISLSYLLDKPTIEKNCQQYLGENLGSISFSRKRQRRINRILLLYSDYQINSRYCHSWLCNPLYIWMVNSFTRSTLGFCNKLTTSSRKRNNRKKNKRTNIKRPTGGP